MWGTMTRDGAEEDSGGCECMEEGRGINGRQKSIKEIERKSFGVLCDAGLPLWSQNGGTDRDNNRGCRSVRTTGLGGLWE